MIFKKEYKQTEEHKRNIKEAKKGHIHPMLGKENKWGKHSDETKKKMS